MTLAGGRSIRDYGLEKLANIYKHSFECRAISRADENHLSTLIDQRFHSSTRTINYRSLEFVRLFENPVVGTKRDKTQIEQVDRSPHFERGDDASDLEIVGLAFAA